MICDVLSTSDPHKEKVEVALCTASTFSFMVFLTDRTNYQTNHEAKLQSRSLTG